MISAGLFQHLSDAIRRLRVEQQLSQGALANLAGVSTSTVSRLESGGGARIEVVDRVLVALGVSDWLDLLQEFASTAARGTTSGRYSRGVLAEIPQVLRLEPGRQESVAAYVQVGERRILLTVNLLDLPPAGGTQAERKGERPYA